MSTETFLKGPKLVAAYENNSIRLNSHMGEGLVCVDFPKEWLEWVDAYVRGDQGSPLVLKLDHLTLFQREVLEALNELPRGSTMTYGALASSIGRPGAARAVGNSCRLNPYPFLIPCHRIVASTGVGGFAYPLKIKEILLEFECGTVPAFS